MGKVSELLSEAWIERQIDECRLAVEESAGREAWKERLRAKIMSDADGDEDPSAPPKTGGPPVRVALQWAALEHTRGASPEVVRTICRNMTSDWLVVVQSLNFTPREYKFTLTQPSVAKELVEAFQGEMTQEGRTYHVRYLAKPQAFSLDMPYVWMCAAI